MHECNLRGMDLIKTPWKSVLTVAIEWEERGGRSLKVFTHGCMYVH